MDAQALLDFLKKQDPAMAEAIKTLTVGDVHQPTALGNEKGKRKKPGRRKPISVTEGVAPHKEQAAPEVTKDAGDDDLPPKDAGALKEKAEVQYTDTATGSDFCANCIHRLGQNACSRVKGVIALGGWCNQYAVELDYDKDVPLVAKKDAPRQLKMFDKKHAHTPFPWDASAMGNLRPDQVPRFLSAVTNPELLDKKDIKLRKLTALQNRVDMKKVEKLREDGPDGSMHGAKDPVVVKVDKGKRLIADGHHRLTADWLDGEDKVEVRYVDISPVDESLTAYDEEDFEDNKDQGDPVDKQDWGVPFIVTKVDADQRMIFGFASIVEKNGKLVIDKQDDVILPDDLEKAVYDFVLFAQQPNEEDVEKYLTELDPMLGQAFRALCDETPIEKRATMGFMHEKMGMGRVIETMMFTKQKVAALDAYLKEHDAGSMDMRLQGWWIGFKVDNDDVWALHKAGKLPEFSIGGRGKRVPV